MSTSMNNPIPAVADKLEFPDCDFQGRQLTPTKRFCRHKTIGRGYAVTIYQCLVCPAANGGEVRIDEPVQFNEGLCVRRTKDPVKSEQVPTCCGDVSVEIFGCSMHEQCTEHQKVGRLKVCETCKDFLKTE